MAIIKDANMRTMLKTVYLSGVANDKYQNSPILSAIPKETWAGGDTIKYAAQYGNGGNFGSVYSTVANNMTEGVQNLEWEMKQGYAFGLFNINQPELLATREERGAYMKALANKMAGCFDGLSKTLATYLYGGKYGVMGQVIDPAYDSGKALESGDTNEMVLNSSTVIKMDIGTRFVIATEGSKNGAKPSSPIGSTICTVLSIDDNKITFRANGTPTIYVGDYIELYTARGADDSPRGFEGLADIIPSVADRNGAVWTNYIKESFRGINRSKATSRLAGQFVKAAEDGATRLTDGMVSLLKKTKRAGGLNNIMIINDETWDAVGAELGIQKNLWQATDGAVSKQGATVGINELATAFGDAFVGRTVIDPYCTEGLAYSLEKDDLKFYDLGNVSRAITPTANDQMGKADISAAGDQGFGDTISPAINMDKLFTVEQGTAGEYGPELRIAANIFGNFALTKTASVGVAVLK